MKNIQHISYKIFVMVLTSSVLINCIPNQQTPPPMPQLAQATTPFPLTSTATMTVTPSPTETQKPTSTPIQITTSTPTPIPTINSINREVENLLQSSKFEHDAITRILEYLYQHPKSPHRQALLYKVIGLSSRKSSQWWVIEDWLKKFVLEPFNQSGELPPGFEIDWERWGEIFSGDLDGNDEPDYVITFGNKCINCEDSHIYWIHQINGQYELTPLPTRNYATQDIAFIEVFAFDDLTNNGQSELVYSVVEYGPSDRFDTLRVLIWQNGQLTNLLTDLWYVTNGDVVIQNEDKDESSEIVITQGSTGYSGMGPFLPYKVHLNLLYGEYIPIEQNMFDKPGRWSRQLSEQIINNDDLIAWQRAKQLLHTNDFDKAIEEFDKLANLPPSLFPWINYSPYASFNIGVIHTILGNEIAAQNTWEQIITRFPNHPVGVDIISLKDSLNDKENFGYICTWLYENASRWKETRWMASDWAILDSKSGDRGVPVATAQAIFEADNIDFVKERESLEYIEIRAKYYSHHTDWWGFCHPMFLIPLYEWKQEEAVNDQMNQRGLNWHTLSIDYDLNEDTTPDVIGFLETNEKRVPLVFISQDDVYQPLFIMQPYPIEAINIWDVTQYKYDRGFSSDVDIKVIATNINNMPQIIIDNSQIYQWIGHRFQYLPMKSTEPTIETELPNPLDEAIEQLFRYKQPQEALNILQEYEPDDNGKVVQLYFQALAFQYDKRYEQAKTIFSELIKDYPDTSWASLAKEKLELEIYN